MAEFNLDYDQNLHARPGHGPPPQTAAPVEWYSASAGTYDPAAYSTYTPATASVSSAAAYGSFEDEPPLLEELGIDLTGIWRRTIGIITFRLKAADMEEPDVGGPLLFAGLMGLAHLLWQGKVHFGVILGWSVLGALAVWFVVRNMAGADNPDAKAIDLYSAYCLLGYCMLPMLGFAIFSILLPKGMIQVGAGALATLWCAMLASRMFARRSPVLEDHRSLIAYPCFLVYSAFALLTLY